LVFSETFDVLRFFVAEAGGVAFDTYSLFFMIK
jgi:hypothetical protein